LPFQSNETSGPRQTAYVFPSSPAGLIGDRAAPFTSPDHPARHSPMIIILGLIVLVTAVVIGVAGVLGNDGSGHASLTGSRCSATT